MVLGSVSKIVPHCFLLFIVAVVAAAIVVKPVIAIARNSDKPIFYNFLEKENELI